MKKAIRDAWVQSLRSGLYPQIQGALCRKENGGLGFCCLGVLLDVYDPTGWGSPPAQEGDLRLYGHHAGTPPPDVQESLGLSLQLRRLLLSLNDNDKLPFTEIASWIEQNVPVEEVA